jgi:hypothetical protein
VGAGAGVLGILGYWHFMQIAYADPLMVALALAAIDCHLCGRPRATWVLIVLLALGRPEAWPIGVLYGAWSWRRDPASRPMVLAGAFLVVVLWVGVSRLASPYWLVSSHIEKLSTANFPVHGSRLSAVLDGFFSLYEFPVQLAAVGALALGVLRRDLRALGLFAVAALWVIADIALGLNGEIPSPRYMFEPAGVEVMLVAAGVGWILASRPRPAVLRWVGVAAAIALVAVMVPNVRFRGRLVHNGIRLGRTWTKVITRLRLVLAHEGGTAAVLACGTPVTSIPFQSILAWQMGLNVRQVGWVPTEWIAAGQPAVVFTNVYAGWQVRVYHTTRPGCSRLERDTPTN